MRGGDKRDRTADLLNAIQTLSQLSYTPMLSKLEQRGRRYAIGTKETGTSLHEKRSLR